MSFLDYFTPIIRNNETGIISDAVGLKILKHYDWSIKKGDYNTILENKFYFIRFWSGNPYYAWMSEGEFLNKITEVKTIWLNEMPRRITVNKVRKHLDKIQLYNIL